VRSVLKWMALPGAALTLTLAGSMPAQAQPSPEASGNVSSVARTGTGKAVTDRATTAAVTDFWTPARMAAAVDLDRDAAVSRKPGLRPSPSGAPGSVAPAAPRRPFATAAVNQSLTVGKVYVATPGGLGQCSASALNSGKRRLVITAGHCVHAGAGGGWYWNLIFVPGMRGASEPAGRFAAFSLTTRTAWITGSSPDEDMAIAIMHNGGYSNAKVVDSVGGNGLRWNWGYGVFVTILGYPVVGYPGDTQYYCQSSTWWTHGQELTAWCGMTEGSSGGPWLQDYNGSTGLGYVNSVTSHRHGDARQMYGPYFDDDAKSLFDYAEALSPA
jgi:V8-like Glu-specific endopeptidase